MPQEQENSQGQNTVLESETEVSSTESTQQIQQMNQVQQPVTNTVAVDPAYLEAIQQTLRQSHQEAQALREQLARVESQVTRNAEPPRDKEALRQAYFDDPDEMTRNAVRGVLKDELEAAMAPMREVLLAQKRTTVYSNAMAQVKSDPRFARAFQHPSLEGLVEQQLTGLDLTKFSPEQVLNTVQMAVVQIQGALSLDMIPGITAVPVTSNTPTPTNEVRPNMDAPHIRTTNPNPPVNVPAQKNRPLTESERTIMRMNGIKTEEEYHQWMNLAPNQVAESTIGKAAK